MEKILFQHIDSSNFAEQFPTFDKLEDLFREMHMDRLNLAGEVAFYESDQQYLEANLKVWKEEVSNLKVIINADQAGLNATENPRVREKYMGQIYRHEYRLMKLEKKLAQFTPFRHVKATLRHQANLEIIKAMDNWMEAVGAWFEGGALGEGVLTYNGKTFRYKKTGDV